MIKSFLRNCFIILLLIFQISCINNPPLRTTSPLPQITVMTYNVAISRSNNQVSNMRNWTDWTPEHRLWLQGLPQAFRSIAHLVMVQSESQAHFVIRTFDSQNCQTHGAGAWVLDEPRSIYLNTACFSNQNMLLVAATHELEHAIDFKLHQLTDPMAGQWHICQTSQEQHSDCHPRFHGIAILNPSLPYEEEIPPEINPTNLDIQFLYR